MAPPPVPLRARMTAVAGALVLTPDTALMRLTKMQTSSRWYTAWGIVLWRGAVRAVLLPPLWMVIKGESPRAFARDARDLGWRRLCGGALLYTIQNVAFIILQQSGDATGCGDHGACSDRRHRRERRGEPPLPTSRRRHRAPSCGARPHISGSCMHLRNAKKRGE